MTEANKILARRWFQEVWNEGREATIDELFAEGGVAHGLGDSEAPVDGPDQMKTFVRNLRGSIPDIQMTIQDIVAEEDKVMVRVVAEGTHTGHGLGVAPSGRRIRIAGIVLLRASKGQLIEGWNSWDQLGLLRQIGALPSAADDRFITARS